MSATKDFAFGKNKDLKYLQDAFNEFFNNKMNTMFPVGSIVVTASNSTPASMGYIGTWEQISGGYALVSRRNDSAAPFNGSPLTPIGSDASKHTHTIYDTEQWKPDGSDPDPVSGERVPPLGSNDRRIYADLIDANSGDVDQERSRQASSAAGYGDAPVERLVFHSDNAHSEYWRDTDPDGNSHTFVDYDYGTLELRPTWPRTVLNGDPEGHSRPSPNNAIEASYIGGGSEIQPSETGDDAAYPPSYLVNIWKRIR